MTTDAEQGGPPLPALFNQARNVTVEHLHRRLAEEGFSGMRYAHGAVFRHIDVEGSRLTTLAERADLTKQAMGEVVGDLERLGYVERSTDPADQRAKIIRLTTQGVAAHLAASRVLGEIEQEWVRRLGEDEVSTMCRTLRAVIQLEKNG